MRGNEQQHTPTEAAMRGKEEQSQQQLSLGLSGPPGATGSIQQDQNFDLNVLNEFILKDLEEGQNRNSVPCDFTNPHIGEIRNQLMNHIPGWAASPVELMPMDTCSPQLVSRGAGSPQLVKRGAGSPQLVSRGTGSPQLVSRGTGSPQLVSRGTGPPQLVSRGTGSPQLVRKDNQAQDTKRKMPYRGGRRVDPPSSRASSRHFGLPLSGVFVKEEMPKLVIVEQPKQRGMRFRYECEGRSAGSIPGENTTEQTKTLPTIQIQNWQGEVKVIISLVTKDEPYKPHPHSLVGKDCQNGICEVTVSPKCNMKASFANLGIQCMKKKEIGKALEHRLKLGIDPFNVGDSARCSEDVDMNVVRLCFQAFIQETNLALAPVLSDPIYDKKATNTSELRICRLNKDNGVCTGGEELFLLCDKVQKEDIAVVFSRGNWEAKGVFSQTDVHRQIAIVFKTPPYCDIDIQEPVTVRLQLYRPSDKEYSESFEFRYLPKLNDAYGVRSKCTRKIKFPSINTLMGSNLASSEPVTRLKNQASSFTQPDPPAIQMKQTIKNRDFQFPANMDVGYNFQHEEDQLYLNPVTKPWNCYTQEDYATAVPYTDNSLEDLQDDPYSQCYMKDEPLDTTNYGFYSQLEELRKCREPEGVGATFDTNYNVLPPVEDLPMAPADGDLDNYMLNMDFANGSEELSTILGSSIAMPNEQPGSKG
ncbi:transcription factor RelB homolog isoform X1 [Chiloscyllium plagiosum]|uniref:transcription factor RelB homolog isoform X1 n=1 Tax=Chiloscyllium plagiosum TaxID=36176 RepID=UPI001CB85AAE|nr:transcription factor RelB homolog isoform X1 [Chiloscyllium plagiosum]